MKIIVGWVASAFPPNLNMSNKVQVTNFGLLSGSETGVEVTTVSCLLIFGGWVTKVSKDGYKK